MLGKREPDIYGSQSLDDIARTVEDTISLDLRDGDASADKFKMKLVTRQTNSEAELITWFNKIFQDVQDTAGIIINPGAFTHYSYGLRDAIAMFISTHLPIVEVHISNPHRREDFRHLSVISPVVTGTIAGFGIFGYKLAADYIRQLQNA
jgi:3-dehydroquinate dehydratase-2